MTVARGRLIIVCGLPGSGKTTAARDLAQRLGASRYDPDEWMTALSLDLYDEPRRATIEAIQWQAALAILKLGGTAIVEWGTWGRSERDTLRLGARAVGAAVELVYLEAPADVLFERIQRRNRETPPVSRDMLEQWMAKFQAPTADEFALYDRATGDTLN
jgi:predicted kinase